MSHDTHTQKTHMPQMNQPIERAPKGVISWRIIVFRTALLTIGTILLLLTGLVIFFKFFPLDLLVTKSIQQFHPLWFDIFMKFLTFIGNPLESTILTLLVIGFLFFKKERQSALMLTFSTIGIEVIASILKVVVQRPRPNPALIHQFSRYTLHDSFPSGHVSFYMGFFGFLLFLIYTTFPKKAYRTIILVILSILICFIGLSRIYLGAHWFSDVLGAYLLGILWLSLMAYMYKNITLENYITRNRYTKILTILIITTFILITVFASVNMASITKLFHW